MHCFPTVLCRGTFCQYRETARGFARYTRYYGIPRPPILRCSMWEWCQSTPLSAGIPFRDRQKKNVFALKLLLKRIFHGYKPFSHEKSDYLVFIISQNTLTRYPRYWRPLPRTVTVIQWSAITVYRNTAAQHCFPSLR